MQAVSDEQLIQWVAAGDASCLGTLFERHHRGVYQFCLQMTRRPAASEDLVQDVFLKILKRARTYRGDGSFKAWLYLIARNLTFDYLRKSSRRGAEVPAELSTDERLIDRRSAEQAAAGEQDMRVVAAALAGLSTAAQEVIWLGRFEFDNYEDLGQALGCKPGAARVRMHRAMQQLSAACANLNGETANA